MFFSFMAVSFSFHYYIKIVLLLEDTLPDLLAFFPVFSRITDGAPPALISAKSYLSIYNQSVQFAYDEFPYQRKN